MIVIAIIAGVLAIIGGLVAMNFLVKALAIDTTNLPQQILVGVWQIEGLLGLLIVAICLVGIVAAQAASTLPGRAGNREPERPAPPVS